MSQAFAGITVVLAAWGVVALLFAASDARAIAQANPHPLLRRWSGLLALLLAGMQIGYAIVAIGPVSGIALVISASMTAGMLVTAAINAAPTLILRGGLLATLVIPVSTVAAFL